MRNRRIRSLVAALFAATSTVVSLNVSAQESDLAALRAAPPSDAGTQLRLGRALRRAGHFDEALRALRAASRGPTRPEALYEIARVRFDQGNFREARAACNAIPAGISRHVCLARAHLVWQRTALAEREITAAQRIDASNPELKLVIADSMRTSGRATEAEAAYREAASALPNRAEPHLGLGVLFETANRLDDARAAFQRAVDADAKDPAAALALGRLLRRMRQNDAALPLLQRANNDRPDWPDALVALGDLYIARNALDDAQRTLARAVQIVQIRPGRNQDSGACTFAQVACKKPSSRCAQRFNKSRTTARRARRSQSSWGAPTAAKNPSPSGTTRST